MQGFTTGTVLPAERLAVQIRDGEYLCDRGLKHKLLRLERDAVVVHVGEPIARIPGSVRYSVHHTKTGELGEFWEVRDVP